MKKSSLYIKLKIAGYACVASGWWGTLYPEFAMTEDVYRVVTIEESIVYGVNECLEMQSTNIYWEMLEAGPEKIRIRSKFLEKLSEE